ncbi:E3 ubiquitin/ISG15 ligase TRIM25-like [Eleutherodactylus coqui]|uniref:E3 ubiquitin/ISG15 ligase TRIM25-like n=1 Tax=Eleutherodactylus coqui TaxID=57060 RepID=UPI003462FE12
MASSDVRCKQNCSICLSTYIDAVTLGCGHNFCRVCIHRVLDTQDEAGVYSCPECREEFPERPVLENIEKCYDAVERDMSTQPDPEEITGILCTYCIHSPVPAAKSCLLCEASLCDHHLRVHSKAAEHVLTEPSANLEVRKCDIHKRGLEYYCIEDAACICASCSLTGKHKGHQIELLDEALLKKKKWLRNVSDNLLAKREGNVSRIEALCKHITDVHERAQATNQSISGLFIDIRRQVDDLEKVVCSEISRQEEQMSLSVSDLIQHLEIEKDDLHRTIVSFQQMSLMRDPIVVLRNQELYRYNTGKIDTCTEDDMHTIGDLDILPISYMIHRAMRRIIEEANSRGFREPTASGILLDINTAGKNVAVSDTFQMASWSEVSPNHQATSKTFQSCQVLSINYFSSGEHFLEVDSKAGGDWCVGMSYDTIDRKGERCIIGHNDKSWGLRLWSNQYSVVHDSRVVLLPVQPSCKKLGLYLDYEAGRLSFYELSDPIRHLHTFSAKFTEPLRILCWVMGSSLKFHRGSLVLLRKILDNTKEVQF